MIDKAALLRGVERVPEGMARGADAFLREQGFEPRDFSRFILSLIALHDGLESPEAKRAYTRGLIEGLLIGRGLKEEP